MSEEPLVNKSQPSFVLPDEEYDIIYATVSETAQGRRFLEEYARRCRPSETEASLAAIARMQAAIRNGDASDRLELLLEMADMAQAIVRLRAEILAMKPPGAGSLDATEELDSIVQTTESATSRILAAAEQVQEIAWTMRESGSIEALCDELDAQATQIYTACSFQDLTGQRTRKVIQLLRYLEERINATIAAQDKAPAAGDMSSASSLIQAGVDAVMQPDVSPQEERQEERQDATLEDISRLMLAIEPMIGLLDATAVELAEQPGATIVQAAEEVRPELSVADTVMAEADNARKLAEWAVEPAAPAQPKALPEDSTPLADSVVEDPGAPQPDSEPAWMILRRIESERDEVPETEAEATIAEPAISTSTAAEPALFAAEAMSQLAQTLQPATLLPPAELVFRASPKSIDPLAELETAMAAAEMRLLPPDEDAERPAAAAPEAVESPPTVAVETPAPEASNLMKRAAVTAIEPREPAALTDKAPPPAEADPDDFLFAPEEAPQEAPVLQQTTAEEPAPPPVAEWEGGTFPDPALVTPETLPPPPAAVEQPKSHASYDPLAPLRALSDAQKIALFS